MSQISQEQNIIYHKYDLPNDFTTQGASIAIDTEAMGLNNARDRLCVIQLSCGDGTAHVVHFPTKAYDAPNLRKLLTDNAVHKIFHFARFDVSIIYAHMGILVRNLYCTKIASRLVRTYTDQHGLKDLCAELLDIKISKQQRSSYWGANSLTEEQLHYAASDVLYLHKLMDILNQRLKVEDRMEVALELFKCIPARAMIDTMGWVDIDIFSH